MYRIRVRLKDGIDAHPLISKWRDEEARLRLVKSRQELIDRIHELDVLVEARWFKLKDIVKKQEQREERIRVIRLNQRRKGIIL